MNNSHILLLYSTLYTLALAHTTFIDDTNKTAIRFWSHEILRDKLDIFYSLIHQFSFYNFIKNQIQNDTSEYTIFANNKTELNINDENMNE